MWRIRILLAGLFGASPAALGLELELPVPCPADGCVIQRYFDHDAGPGERDFACGVLVDDGHDGTDFRIGTLKDMERGVPVMAAAPGRVRAVRDGMPDRRFDPADAAAIAGRECGNGVVIDHEEGWQTQYCHLKQGSVTVRPGESVAKGQTLGQVGLSGQTQFPHVHLNLRKDGRLIDPFRPEGARSCAADLTGSVWSAAAAARLAYRSPHILDGGLSGERVEMPAVEAGTVAEFAPGAPAMVGWARALGLRAGEIMTVRLVGPEGAVLAENRSPVLDRSKAQYLLYAGRRRPPQGWPPGRYAVEVAVERDGQTVSRRSFSRAVTR